METSDKIKITVQTLVNAPIEKIWNAWNKPGHITQWCQASDDWHAPYAENDLKVHGKFKTTMAAKDGSMSFDFEGIYNQVASYALLDYTITDGRRVTITFTPENDHIRIVEIFEAETMNPIEMQRAGWQAILDNFKSYTEALP
jgi:uncharacterized protein YndB with AHSA1/START domain